MKPLPWNSPSGHNHTLDDNGGVLLDLLASIYLENGQARKAAILLETLQTLGLTDTRQCTMLAWAQLRAGQPDRALNTLDQLALQAELHSAFHLVRAQTLVVLGRRSEAQAAMQAYVALRADALQRPVSQSA